MGIKTYTTIGLYSLIDFFLMAYHLVVKINRFLAVAILVFSFLPSFSQEKEKIFQDKSFNEFYKVHKTVIQNIDFPLPQPSLDNENQKSVCKYPNENIHQATMIMPVISDHRRVEAILDLIAKIARCENLPYKEDGQIFKNREGKLPLMESGYYREYTLVLPKDSQSQFYIGQTQYTALPYLSERGPERIVIGGGTYVYYTPNHYASFVLLNMSKSFSKN